MVFGFFKSPSLESFLVYTQLFLVFLWIQNTKEDELVFIKSIFRKFFIFTDSIFFMIFSKDSKGVGMKKNPDPDLIKDKNLTQYKTLIFIRHGESDWNDVFNKGINIGMIFRLANALYKELLYYPTLHSVFLDSPLNLDGIEQAVQLNKFITSDESLKGQNEEIVKLLNALRGDDNTNSIVTTSCLRRAIATTTVSLWHRLQTHPEEKIHILSSLQEISRNIDTYCLAPTKSISDLPFERIKNHCEGTRELIPEDIYETVEHHGNKKHSFYGIKRFKAFNEWAFARKEEYIIVGGHSLWFKYFFQTYLPHASTHEAKTKKITNSGVVACKIYQYTNPTDGITSYRIDPESVVTVYGGFTTK